MTKSLKEWMRELAKEEGIIPLLPGQVRPDGYYMGDHYTGESRIPRNAVIDLRQEEQDSPPAPERD